MKDITGKKIKLEELIGENWVDTEQTYADLLILKKGDEIILYDSQTEKVYMDFIPEPNTP